MDSRRYNLLMRSDEEALTPSEIAAGWHFCWPCDGLLVGPGMIDHRHCTRLPQDHPVYRTAPPVPEIVEIDEGIL